MKHCELLETDKIKNCSCLCLAQKTKNNKKWQIQNIFVTRLSSNDAASGFALSMLTHKRPIAIFRVQ